MADHDDAGDDLLPPDELAARRARRNLADQRQQHRRLQAIAHINAIRQTLKERP